MDMKSVNEMNSICKKYGIKNYTIMDDGSIDVDGSVDLTSYELTELPLKFGVVTWNFFCSQNNLTTLKGCPREVSGRFTCNHNNLTTLSGSPESVGSHFNCSNNYLTTLEGSPKSIGDGFDCDGNNLTSLEGSPESIGGSFYCFKNNLTDLKGSPKSIGGGFYCHTNPIGSIFDKVDIDFIRTFKTFKVIKDGIVNLKRLRYVMEMFDLPIDLKEIEKHYTIK